MLRFLPAGAAALFGLMVLVSTAKAGLAPFLDGPDYLRAIELYNSVLTERAPGLLAEPLDFADQAGAACVAGRPPRTHAILVGATDLGLGNRYLMKGTTNDVSLLRSLLADRGVSEQRIHVLLDDEATRENIVGAFRKVVSEASCDDRVILHFSTHAIDAQELAQGTIIRAGETTTDPKVTRLLEEALIKDAMKRLGAEVLLRDDPGEFGHLLDEAAHLQLAFSEDLAILLNDESETYNELIRGRDVSDFMVAVRNRGAHAVTVLDVREAALARIEDRQNEAGDQSNWSFQYETRNGDYWQPVALDSGHGSFTVLYATDVGEVTPELRLPRGVDRDLQKIYGLFTFVTGSELLENRYATPRTVAAAIQRTYDSTYKQKGLHPIVRSSEPDLVLIAEVAPQRADPIRIISPKPTRGAAAMEKAEVDIEGLIEWSAPVLGVMVDNAPAAIKPDGSFRHAVELKTGMNTINVIAITADSRLHQKTIDLVFEGDRAALEGEGKRYAVVIANQNYTPESGMPSLSTPFADADALTAVLAENYGFATEITLENGKTAPLVLKDPTNRDIEIVLHQLGKVAGAKDTVLIFFAGHGVFEPVTSIAYWVPSDAEAGFEPSYLSASDISAAIQRIQAGHVILISDSCYSGALLRGGQGEKQDIDEGQRVQALLKMQSRKSRIVITSGNNEPVADLGGDGHSVFARALLTGLRTIDHDAFSARELFDGYIIQQVTANADQEPQYRPLEKVGHEGGDFVFVRNPAQ